MDKDDCATPIELGPDGVEKIVADVDCEQVR